jgi:hypothetical protein
MASRLCFRHCLWLSLLLLGIRALYRAPAIASIPPCCCFRDTLQLCCCMVSLYSATTPAAFDSFFAFGGVQTFACLFSDASMSAFVKFPTRCWSLCYIVHPSLLLFLLILLMLASLVFADAFLLLITLLPSLMVLPF